MNKEKILMDLIMDHHHSGKLVWKKTIFSDMFETEINNLEIKIFMYDTGSNIRFQTRTSGGLLSDIVLREKEYPEIGLIVKSLPIPPPSNDIDDIIDSLDGKRDIRDKKIKSILEQDSKEQESKSISKTVKLFTMNLKKRWRW